MHLISFDPTEPSHLSALVNIWNTACGTDLAINSRLAGYNTHPVTGAVQAGRLAQHGDRLSGFVLASALPNDSLTSPPEIGWIDAIAVLPDFQRRGIGSELMTWAEDWLIARASATARLGGSLRPFAAGYPVELGNAAFFQARGYVERANAPFVWDVAQDLRSLNLAKVSKPSQGLVRPAVPGDQDALLNFLRREFPNRWRFEFEEFLREHGRISDYKLLVIDSRIAGFARLTYEDSERPIERYYMQRLPRPYGQLGPIGIGASHRGQGLGMLLLNAALSEMKSRGVRGCVIDWTDLLDFYSKFGFEPYRQYAVLSKSLATRTAPATGSGTSAIGAKRNSD